MMIRKMTVAALSTALMLTVAGQSPADPGKKDQAPAPLQLPITGTAAGGVSFAGTFDLQKFVVRDGQVAAVGIVRGTLTGPTGTPLGSALAAPITLPVRVEPGGPITTVAAPSGAAVAAQATCSVLHLDLGAVNLNLLGLQVATQPISLDISGDAAGPLGHLVCTILDTLNNVIGLVDLLNQLLGLLTGLLGAIIPG